MFAETCHYGGQRKDIILGTALERTHVDLNLRVPVAKPVIKVRDDEKTGFSLSCLYDSSWICLPWSEFISAKMAEKQTNNKL